MSAQRISFRASGSLWSIQAGDVVQILHSPREGMRA